MSLAQPIQHRKDIQAMIDAQTLLESSDKGFL